ncbi:MFS transporter, YNFM family, putative membrane transport protein [Georgenia satyanarayanai]|uniref:MFS transporter, YNFM family, putative membrane transport protein n=1 Tax=Georgenia satyanarayanai TaxID=860221 RepID=A0A2Y9BV40_9MICO|nr:MFS transporter [Georgenia satyanarayanai]PYG01899.1 YNFM family putative membrane transporter [Georgenia satyanarayanai]SSA36702.1 MFS transporter, YNFM family, putative membrane transport protein [Georgenia satyanarayanai]
MPAAQPAVGLRPQDPQYRRALLALGATGVAAFAMVYVVQPLLPLVSAELDVGATRASLLVSASTLGIAVAVLPLARLSERTGRGRTMVLGLAGAVVAGVVAALAPTFALMLLARAVQGAAMAAVPAAALAWVAENVAPGWVTRVAGLYIAGTTVGGMGGRVVGGIVADVTTWRTAMLVVALAGAALTAAAALLLPRRSPGVVATDARRTETDGARAARLRVYLLGGLGMAMFVGIYNVIAYRTHAPPFLLGTGLGSMFYLTYLAGTATSSLAGRLERRVGLRATALTGLTACAAGVALTVPDSLVLVWVGLAVVAAGFFMVHAVASAASARLSPRPSDGSGSYTLAYYAGSSVGGVLLGQAWEAGAWGGTTVAAVALIAVAGAVALGLPRGGGRRR